MAFPKGVFVCMALLALSLVPAYAAPAEEKAAPRKPVTVTSNSMEADSSKNLVVFKGDVVAQEDFRLCSDELYIYYDDKKDVKEIVAVGNVRLIKDTRDARGAKAQYDRTARTVTLTGSPTITRCKNTVSGDSITFHLDSENAMVKAREGSRVKAVIMPEDECKGDVSKENICPLPR